MYNKRNCMRNADKNKIFEMSFSSSVAGKESKLFYIALNKHFINNNPYLK